MGELGVDVEPKVLRKPTLEKSVEIGRDLIWYRIKDESGKQIGFMQVAYDPRSRTSKLGLIDIDEGFQRMGYGTEVYKQIPLLPSPDGGSYTFRSSSTLLPDGGAKELWESLVRDGFARTIGNGAYEMISETQSPPRPTLPNNYFPAQKVTAVGTSQPVRVRSVSPAPPLQPITS